MTGLKDDISALFARGVPHQDGAPILDVKDLTVSYHTKRALDSVSFQLTAGERMAIVGPNGAGKSTLLKAIAGLIGTDSGTIAVYGHEPGGHICIAYVPQRSQVDWNFPVNVFDVVMMGRTRKIGLVRWPSRTDRQHVLQCLEMVGMADCAARQIGELSGGQQQRVFIARALAQEAHLMMLDEPLTGLDITSQQDIFHILDELQTYDVTVLVSMHDLNQAAEYFNPVMLLNNALVGFGSPSEVFTLENLITAYGGHIHIAGNGTMAPVLVDTCCQHGRDEDSPHKGSPHA
jgi:ABC-type Mn2+/Zn2+ transport system ATPase subunit